MKENTSIDHIRLETRALNIHGTLEIFVAPSSGKGHDSGYTKVRNGLEALGFRVTSLEPTGTPVLNRKLADEQPAAEKLPEGDSLMVHVPDATRGALIEALATMPDEAFGWFVLACPQSAMTQGGAAQIWPDGTGGFTAESRKSIDAVRDAAQAYMENRRRGND